MKREELLCSIESLKYKPSWRELACSAFVMLVTGVFAFFFASASSNSIDVTWAGNIVSTVWHKGGGLVRNCLGETSSRLFLRVFGSVLAGFSAAVIFVLIRFMMFGRMRVLRLIEYCRMRYRLFYWTLCVVLSLSLSRFFVDLFVPVTFQTLLVTMASVVILLGILYLQTGRSLFLIVAYVLMGFFSAWSVAGFVVMLAVTAFYAIETSGVFKPALGYGYGYGSQQADAYSPYGQYGGAYSSYCEDVPTEDNRTRKLSFNAVFAERLRLMLVFAYILGVAVAVVLSFSCGIALGFDLRALSYDWLKCYVVEFESTVTLVMIALACVVTIAGIFTFNRFNLMLTDEYYLKTNDVFRLLTGAFLGCLVLLGIGRSFNPLAAELQRGNMFVPLVLQFVAALVILMAVVVFITSLKCRKYGDMNLDEGSEVHQSNWLTFFLLLVFDIVPVALPVISTFYVWRCLI